MTAVARLRRAIFARHANPWSAWTRWATTPLVLLPVWSRRWSHAAVVAAWFAVNPVVFPKPADERAWSTRAMLGEELWITRRRRDAAMAVSVGTGVAQVAGIVAARKRRWGPMVAATAVQMGLTLVYWELMVRFLARQRGPHRQPTGTHSQP
jgi:hypothetical protein